MRLNNLEITINGKLQRKITFQQGINIVTNRPGVGRTGNSVGKSTLSRVVDYIMLGDIANIYIDDEFKKPNKIIEDLFDNNEVIASLSFTDANGLLNQASRTLVTSKDESKYFINGKATNSKNYESFIQEKIFSITTQRPSVRAAISKFIRNDSFRMLNTKKFLSSMSTAKDYSEIYLYLFGFKDTSLLTKKRQASNLVSLRTRNSKAINSMIKEQKPASEIKEYQKAIKELEENILKFDYFPSHSNPIEKLSALQKDEEALTAQLISTERKINNINETIEILSKDKDGYLIKEINEIYKYAGASVSTALTDLEDVILFHKNLINKKKKFLSTDIPALEETLLQTKESLDKIRKEKLNIFSAIRSKDAIEQITSNLKKLGDLKITLGKLEGFLEQQTNARKYLSDAETSLAEIIKEINKELGSVLLFNNKLNEHFKRITKAIHAEEYETKLNIDESKGSCDIEIINSAANPEGGKKKAEVIAFDLAYIHAVHDLSLKRPTFVFHDSVDDIDTMQVREIFLQSKSLPGQQILSILSDHVDKATLREFNDSIILFLDESDKFFGI